MTTPLLNKIDNIIDGYITHNITDPEYVIVHPDTWIQIYIDLTNVKNDNKNKIPPFKYNGLMVLRTFDIDEETIIIK